jgi:hypothetical protein
MTFSLHAVSCRLLLATTATFFAPAGISQSACFGPQQQLPAATVSAFVNNPGQLLGQFPDGGGQMIGQIRDLAASDPATLPSITQLVANATPAQKAAIGSGLAQAARVCVRTDQASTALIQQAAAQTGDQIVITAYAAVTGERPLGGLGGGAGALGGAVGGQTNPLPGNPTSTGPAQPISGSAHATTSFGFTSSVTGGSSVSVSP